jgi:ribosome-associated protein
MRAKALRRFWRSEHRGLREINRAWRNRREAATFCLSGNRRTRDLSPDLSREPGAQNPGADHEAALEGVSGIDAQAAARLILQSLDEDKAEDIVSIDVRGKSSVADTLIVASGRSQRHVGALADHLMRKLKDAGAEGVKVEGLPGCDWVLLDAGDVIVHLFKPDVRAFYNIERIWSPAPALAS